MEQWSRLWGKLLADYCSNSIRFVERSMHVRRLPATTQWTRSTCFPRTLTYFTIDRFLRAKMPSREDRTILEHEVNFPRRNVNNGRMVVHFFQAINGPLRERVLDPAITAYSMGREHALYDTRRVDLRSAAPTRLLDLTQACA